MTLQLRFTIRYPFLSSFNEFEENLWICFVCLLDIRGELNSGEKYVSWKPGGSDQKRYKIGFPIFPDQFGSVKVFGTFRNSKNESTTHCGLKVSRSRTKIYENFANYFLKTKTNNKCSFVFNMYTCKGLQKGISELER